jgi:hypothetical protein
MCIYVCLSYMYTCTSLQCEPEPCTSYPCLCISGDRGICTPCPCVSYTYICMYILCVYIYIHLCSLRRPAVSPRGGRPVPLYLFPVAYTLSIYSASRTRSAYIADSTRRTASSPAVQSLLNTAHSLIASKAFGGASALTRRFTHRSPGIPSISPHTRRSAGIPSVSRLGPCRVLGLGQ